jgi:flagellar protein FliL
MAGNRNEEVQAGTPAVPKRSLRERLPKILLWTFLILNGLVMMAGTAVIYNLKIAYQRPSITEETEAMNLAADREIRGAKPVLYTFEPFTINLDGVPRKLVRTTIQLEMLSEEGFEEAVNLNPVARDEIVRIFNSKKYEDIETIQGKLFLKDQIMTAMNNLLSRGSVKEVYFGEFVVQ